MTFWSHFFKQEKMVGLSLLTGGVFIAYPQIWSHSHSSPWLFTSIALALLAIMLRTAFAVVHHAEALAHKIGEPFGTLILTLAVTGIEVVMIASLMMHGGDGYQTMARDAMFAVIMIAMNGVLGLALLLGGLRYHEQSYNLQGANAFLAVILPLAIFALVLPNFTHATAGPTLSTLQGFFIAGVALILYLVFLAIQTLRHRAYFAEAKEVSEQGAQKSLTPTHALPSRVGARYHVVMLIVYLIPMVVLAKQIALPIRYAIEELQAPAALGGLLVSMLILAPESLSAVRAAWHNHLQRAVNLLLGSVLATMSLTIPAILLLGYFMNHTIVLGLDPIDTLMLILTLSTAFITLSSARTNVLLGLVHLLLFFSYLLLMIER